MSFDPSNTTLLHCIKHKTKVSHNQTGIKVVLLQRLQHDLFPEVEPRLSSRRTINLCLAIECICKSFIFKSCKDQSEINQGLKKTNKQKKTLKVPKISQIFKMMNVTMTVNFSGFICYLTFNIIRFY